MKKFQNQFLSDRSIPCNMLECTCTTPIKTSELNCPDVDKFFCRNHKKTLFIAQMQIQIWDIQQILKWELFLNVFSWHAVIIILYIWFLLKENESLNELLGAR
jgi:hypothetical protein